MLVSSVTPSAPSRRPPSSAVSALVLSLTAPLLCAYLRVSPPPRSRRPPSSAVSALVLSLTAPLLCAYLRVSAPPRQNHSLRFPIPFHHRLIRGIELCACLSDCRRS